MAVETTTKSRPAARSRPSGSLPRGLGRRLADKVLIAFHQACDQNDIEVASRLLPILEMLLIRRGSASPPGRRSHDSMLAACERLWLLKHPGEDTERPELLELASDGADSDAPTDSWGEHAGGLEHDPGLE